MWRFLSVLIIVMGGYNVAVSQASESPLSSQGIGDIQDLSMMHQEGMGGLGISTGSIWYMNSINPALLPLNSLTVFGAGFALEKRSIFSPVNSSVNTGGNLSYLGTAFPVKAGRWTTAIGLAPYSTVEYSFINRNPISDTPGIAIRTFEGSGGFNQVYWANGVRLGNNLYVGARTSFLFSSIIKENTSVAIDTNLVTNYQAALFDRVSVSDLRFTLGAVYMKDSLFNRRLNLSVGAIYEPASDINATHFQTLERRTLLGIPFESDTIVNNVEGAVHLPAKYGFGVTLFSPLRWQVGFELRMQDWSKYRSFQGGNENFSDAIHLTVGGEYTPDYASVSNYFNRISYRTGFSYSMLPNTINNSQLTEFGINFGLSLPVSRYSSIDLAMRYGKRGNVSETTIEEEVLRFGLGITFNDQWFIRRKYD